MTGNASRSVITCQVTGLEVKHQIAKANLEVLGDLTDKTLEGQLADQEFGRLLVTPRGKVIVSQQPQGEYVVKESYLISRRATVPGRNLWGFLTPPVGF